MLNDQEKRGLLTIAIMAAFADGSKADKERESIKSVAEAVGAVDGVSMSTVLADVMLRRVDVTGASALLTNPESRQLAYEVAVQVCDADGARGDAETRFLDELASALELRPEDCALARREPDALAMSPLEEGNLPGDVRFGVGGRSPLAAGLPDNDDMIRNYAILCGALELLPQSLAGMAIIPLQLKMVYRIAKSHGETPGATHIKDLLATLGVGLTSQYLEGMGRKLLGGLLKRHVGKWGGKLGGAATGMAMSFVTTYAMGHVAEQYYAGGRRMDTQTLRSAFERARGQATELQSRYLPDMQQQAASLDMGSVMNMIRGR